MPEVPEWEVPVAPRGVCATQKAMASKASGLEIDHWVRQINVTFVFNNFLASFPLFLYFFAYLRVANSGSPHSNLPQERKRSAGVKSAVLGSLLAKWIHHWFSLMKQLPLFSITYWLRSYCFSGFSHASGCKVRRATLEPCQSVRTLPGASYSPVFFRRSRPPRLRLAQPQPFAEAPLRPS